MRHACAEVGDCVRCPGCDSWLEPSSDSRRSNLCINLRPCVCTIVALPCLRRCVCPCGVDFCKLCGRQPYHFKLRCEDLWQNRSAWIPLQQIAPSLVTSLGNQLRADRARSVDAFWSLPNANRPISTGCSHSERVTWHKLYCFLVYLDECLLSLLEEVDVVTQRYAEWQSGDRQDVVCEFAAHGLSYWVCRVARLILKSGLTKSTPLEKRCIGT
eukprot:410881-Amphidinium_carterae.1